MPDEGDPFPALLGAVDKLRQDFDAGVLELDPMLGTLSSEPFERLLAGRFDSSWADERLAGAGFRGPHGVLACSEARLALCVDGWMRRAESRALLLDPTVTLAGGQAAHAGDRVVAVLALAEP